MSQAPPLFSDPALRLKQADPSDAEDLLTLGRSLLSETDFYIRMPSERAVSVQDMARLIQDYADRPLWHMVNVWDGNDAIAEGVLVPGALERTAHIGTIGIGILRRHWGRGIGQVLMHELEARAHHHSLERLEFTVLAHNRRARDFYERLGYTQEGVRSRSVRYASNSASAPVRYGDEIMMAKWIGPDYCIDSDC